MGGTVLVVDDEALIALAMAEVLEAAGFEARIARTGEEALRCCEESTIAAAVVDVNLIGRLTGIETARAIRRETGAPLLMVSGDEKHTVAERVGELSRCTILGKPLAPRVLLSALRDLLTAEPPPTS